MLALASRTPAGYLQKSADFITGAGSRLPWVWDGLCFGLPVVEASRDSIRDVVGGSMGTVGFDFTTSRFIRDGRGNNSIRFNRADDTHFQYPDTPVHDRPSTELTVLARLKGRGTHDNWAGIICNDYASASTGGADVTWSLQMSDNANTNGLHGSMQVNATVYAVTFPAATIPSTQYISVFMRWRTGEAMRIDVYGEGGGLITSLVDSVTATGSLSYAAGKGIRVNASEDSLQNCDMDFSQALVWSRRLTDTEVAVLTMDPFGWYAPSRETVAVASPYPVLAATGSRTSPFHTSQSMPSMQF